MTLVFCLTLDFPDCTRLQSYPSLENVALLKNAIFSIVRATKTNQKANVIMGCSCLKISKCSQNWLEYCDCQLHDNDSNQMMDASVPTWGVALKG